MMKMGGQWIKSAIKKPGAFTKQAKAAGMSVSDFAQSVLSNKEDYSGTTVKRANLAKTLSRMKKAQAGMEFKNPMGADSSLMEMESAPMAASPAMGMQSGSPLMGSDFEVEPSIQALDPNLDFARKDVASLEKQAEKDNVRTYQRMLNQKYGAGLSEDGKWGPKTQAAYEKFMGGKKSESWYTEKDWDNTTKQKDGYFVDDMKSKIAAQTPKTGQDQYEEMMAARRAETARKAKADLSIMGSKPSTQARSSSINYQVPQRPAGRTSAGTMNQAANIRTSGLTNEDFKRFGRPTITRKFSTKSSKEKSKHDG